MPSTAMRPAAAAAKALVVNGATKRYETREGAITAMEGVSFDVAPGEFVSVIGPSGCGKSTLFHTLGGLIPLSAGLITVAGTAVRGPHPAIGMVCQEESTPLAQCAGQCRVSA